MPLCPARTGGIRAAPVPHLGRRTQATQEVLQPGDSLPVDGIEAPPAHPPDLNQASILQHTKMKGQQRLTHFRLIYQLAYAAFAPCQSCQNGQSLLVGEGMEYPVYPFGTALHGLHGNEYINKY